VEGCTPKNKSAREGGKASGVVLDILPRIATTKIVTVPSQELAGVNEGSVSALSLSAISVPIQLGPASITEAELDAA
jgi:hypothetical protein